MSKTYVIAHKDTAKLRFFCGFSDDQMPETIRGLRLAKTYTESDLDEMISIIKELGKFNPNVYQIISYDEAEEIECQRTADKTVINLYLDEDGDYNASNIPDDFIINVQARAECGHVSLSHTFTHRDNK